MQVLRTEGELSVAAGRAGELAVSGGCMAILIPSLGFARFDTRGELRLAERLRTSSKKTLSFGTTSR